MASLVIPNTAQVRLFWTFNGIAGVNVLAGIVAGGFVNSQAIANALGTAILGHFTSSGLAALMATTTSLLGVGVRDIRSANQPEYVSVAASVPGTGTGDPLPNELAAAVTLRTALAGRSFRGRTYFSGAIKDESDSSGRIVAGFNTALRTFMGDVQSDMGSSGLTLAVASRKLLQSNAVTAIATRDTRWDSQRRRQQ